MRQPRPKTRGIVEIDGANWRDVPFDAIVLSLNLLGLLVGPIDAQATLTAVAATLLLGIYWVVALTTPRRDDRLGNLSFVARLVIVLLLVGIVVAWPLLRSAGSPGILVGAHAFALSGLIASLGLALIVARTPSSRLTLIATIGLNPFLAPSIGGHILTVDLALILATIVAARRRHDTLAFALLGAAIAVDWSALPLLPFLVLWLYGQSTLSDEPTPNSGQRSNERRRLSPAQGGQDARAPRLAGYVRSVGHHGGNIIWPLLRATGAGLACALATHLLLGITLGGTTPGALGGTGLATAQFIQGTYGLANLVYLSMSAVGLLLQALIVGGVAFGLLRRQRRDNTLVRAVAGYATVAFVAQYSGPSFSAAALGLCISLCAAALCMAEVRRSHLTHAFLILLMVAPQSLAAPITPVLGAIAALALGLLVLYALLDAWSDGALALEDGGRPWRLRMGLVLALLGIIAVWPEVYGIVARHAAHPWNYVHDVSMQVEEAMRFLLAGKDFYAQTYVHTPMVHWYSSPSIAAALYHTDRTPLGIVGSVPAYLLARATLGWYDQRFVYLPCLALCVGLLLRLPAPREWRLVAIAAVLLNPYIVPGLIYGEDDVLVLALLLLFGHALYRGRYTRAALVLGLACATKHTALFMAPPYLIYVLARYRDAGSWRAMLAGAGREAWPALAAPLAICAPFLAWNVHAFLDGNVGFLAGTVTHSYPIRGVGTYGFSAIVMLGDLARSPSAYFPFTLWQAAFAIPLFVLGARRLWRRPSVRDLFTTYALLLFTCYFFSRFFQESGLAYAVSALVLAALLQYGDGEKSLVAVAESHSTIAHRRSQPSAIAVRAAS